MKLTEIMIFKNDGTENRLKVLQVDETTLSKLTRIRGNLYKDDPRLKLARDLPKPEPEIAITPEMMQRAEESFRLHCTARDVKSAASTPEPKPLSFEEQIQHDWRCNPGVRKEFVSLASYTAYCRAVRDGRAKIAGGCVVR